MTKTELLNWLESAYGIIDIRICECGAISLERANDSFSVEKDNLGCFFTAEIVDAIKRLRFKPEEKYCNCNHCVNHYGLDLCGCGSGERYGDCESGMTECALPSQELPGDGAFEDDTFEDDCPLGGDTENDCADCVYSGEYHFLNGECVLRNETESEETRL
jgi:hypothetical protein